MSCVVSDTHCQPPVLLPNTQYSCTTLSELCMALHAVTAVYLEPVFDHVDYRAAFQQPLNLPLVPQQRTFGPLLPSAPLPAHKTLLLIVGYKKYHRDVLMNG